MNEAGETDGEHIVKNFVCQTKALIFSSSRLEETHCND